ncbi:MAG: RluA family pseudouridine synthase [Hyphomicrobiaceae bacterium]
MSFSFSDSLSELTHLRVEDDCVGLRLDRFVAHAIDRISRQRVKGLLAAAKISVNGEACSEASYKVRAGDRVTVEVPMPEEYRVVAEDIPLNIIYEDRDLLVVDKPAGLVTHPAPGHLSGTLVNALLAHSGSQLSGIGGVRRPGIVHRLDKDTSGLLVVAKNDLAHQGLAEQFAAHGSDDKMERSYIAIVWGEPERARGTIEKPIGRCHTNRRKMAVVRPGSGRYAISHYQVERTFKRGAQALVSQLRLVLGTGRTHQIRVHLSSIGHPLLGDRTYGSGFRASAAALSQPAQRALMTLNRQALHAATLRFQHPRSRSILQFRSALPQDLQSLQIALGSDAD